MELWHFIQSSVDNLHGDKVEEIGKLLWLNDL
jgi:hypothetical protein